MPLSGLHNRERWGEYLQGMTHSLTLRPAAQLCDIDLKTSSRWRHRFLSFLASDQAGELTGIVELDETFLNESFKGQKDELSRLARKRGNDTKPCKKIPVMVARDRQQHTVDGVLKNESAKELCKHLNGRIRVEASVCADAHLAHEKLADLLGFDFRELVTSAGERVKEGIYHIQHVNAYHSHLKRWLGGVFHGVATKCLTNYLGWRRKLTETEKLTAVGLADKIAGCVCYQPATGT